MSVSSLNCGRLVEGTFRPVLGRGRMERLCPDCAELLSALVRAAGDTCQLSLTNSRFVNWLDTGCWTTRDGRIVGPENLPAADQHTGECPCCATFAEDA